ncbi:MAG: glycosyltransferase family 39 protein [bacterium]
MKTGKDLWGQILPLFFRSFGDYKSPLAVYATIPFIFIWGLNEFAVRLTSVFFAVLTIIAFYFLGKIVQSKYFGLILASLFAICPWAIHMSRINWEGQNVFIFLLVLAMITLYKKNKSKRYFLPFSILMGLATYAYSPSKIICPLLFIFVILTTKNSWKRKGAYIIIYIALLIPLIISSINGASLARWNQVSLFNNNASELSPVKKFVKSYLLHFSLEYLFTEGDIGMQGQKTTRHSIRGIGELYLWQAGLIVLGIYYIIKKKKFIGTTLFLLLLYPIPSSLTIDLTPQATRSYVGIIPLTILSAFGLWFVFEKLTKTKKIYLYLSICLTILGGGISLVHYCVLMQQYPQYAADIYGWQYGPKEAMEYFLENKDQYDEIYLSNAFNSPEIFLLFYDPQKLCKQCHILRSQISNNIIDKKLLFAFRPEEISNVPKDKFIVKKTVYYPNNKEALVIGEFTR